MQFPAPSTGAIGPEHWFAQAFAAALGDVAEALQLGGEGSHLEVTAGAAEPSRWDDWAEPLWHKLSWTPGEGAQIWIGCPANVPRALWTHIGGDAGNTDEALETFREMLNQSASGAAAEATSRLGTAMQASAVEPASAPEAAWGVELHFEAAGAAHTIAIVGSVGMAKALNPAAVEEPGKPAGSGAPGEPARPAARARAADAKADPFELIREVSMELAVSFGDTTMPLADVLKLASGAIIELNRSVSDPVEVLVNDSVIARGDVVVVDGNYGVRITEIVSRRDRVKSML